MKLLSRVQMIRRALPKPSRMPAISASGTATSGGMPRLCMTKPANMPATPPMAPTARLISPIPSTTIWAKPIVIWIAANRSRAKRLKSEVKPVAAIEKKIQKPDVTMSSASRATGLRSTPPFSRAAIRAPKASCNAGRSADPKCRNRLTVPIDANTRRLRRQSLAIHDLDLRAHDLAQLRDVLEVDGVRHCGGKAHMKLHQEVRRHLHVERLR